MKIPLFLFLVLLTFFVSAEIKLVTLEYPPYITREGKEVNGVAVKLVEHVFNKLDQPIKINVLPWGRAIQYVRTGKADGIFTAFKTPEREQFAIYIDEVLFEQNIVAIRTVVSDEVWSEDNFHQLRLCLINNVSYGSLLDAMVKQKRFERVTRVKTAEQCLKLLLLNRVDFWINNEFGARYLSVKQRATEQLFVETPPIESTPSYIAFSKKGRVTVEEIEKFNKIVKEMKGSGEYHQLIDEYFKNLAF